jgi:LysM repeat protein
VTRRFGTKRALPVVAVVAVAVIVVVVGLAGGSSLATIRVKSAGETVEVLAERHYGDARKAALIRAANKIEEGQQPERGAFVKIPGPTIHTVMSNETLQKVADRFLSGEGGAALLAEANGLVPGAALKPGQVLTVFAEIEVRTINRSAEELAAVYLGDANLGARIRRYNGVKDGGRLPGKAFLPLMGIEPRASGAPPPTTVDAAPAAKSATPAVAAAPATRAPVATATSPSSSPSPPAPAIAPSSSPPSSTATASGAVGTVVTGSGAAPGYAPTYKRAGLAGFSHAIHTPLQVNGAPVNCQVCHAKVEPDGFQVTAPKAEQCLLCHREAEVLPSALRRGQTTRLPLPMNHKLHVGDNQIDCTVCHTHDPDRPLGIITQGHDSCSACHASGAQAPYVTGDPQGQYCTSCHGSAEEAPISREAQKFLRSHLIRPFGRVGDVEFTHLTHGTFSPGGAPAGNGPVITCRACHDDAAFAESKEQISRVGMQGCMECHRQANAVGLQPPESCQGCHLHHRAGHMPQTELLMTNKPLDHTPFFRRHHADAAREHTPMCASCHAGTDPKDGNRCDTCHQVMKPRDHTAGFRDRIHGRQAQVDATRCQTCHRAERCESCHREVPRSHFPLNVWVEKGLHGSRGRLELSSCMTCHRFEQTCARCHTAVQR